MTADLKIADLVGIDGLRKMADKCQRRIASLQKQLAREKILEVKILRTLKHAKKDAAFEKEMEERVRRHARRER